ncbi:MAG: hypothetical protein NC920_04975, partial [Candidatus Omnitrophica bacterium]|nr:hypothetical protein [Candidatus Omnitrophota bacterium]
MKKVKLVLIFSLLLGSGIVATVALAQQVFNPFMSGQGYQQGVYSGFTPDVDSPNAILGVISNPSPQADPVFFSLPDNIEGWMTLLSDPANYGLIPEFIKWLENNPANIDAFAKYILEHYHELGGLFNALQTQIGTYGFAGSKYNLYFGRESNNFLNLAITDKDNALVLGAVFDKEGKKVSSIEVEGNTATVESSGKTYNLKLINPIKYVPGDGLSSALSFNKDGEISIKLNENSSLVITAQGNLVLKINGKEITLNSTGREVQLTYKAQGEIVISDGDNPARIVVDKNGEVTVWKGRNERTAISGNKIDIEFKPSGEIRLTNEKGEGFIITPQGVVYQTVKLTDAQQLIKYLSSENTIILPENTIILPDGRKIVLPPESQIIQNADGSWTVTLSDGTQIVIDKEGKLMTINRPGVSFQLDISGLSQVNVGLEGDKLTIKGYQTTQVCLEGESPCPANVFSLTISSSGELSVDNGSAKIKVHGVEITLKPGMSLKFDEDAVIVTLKQGISYSINKGGQITGITINGINIPLPPGVKPSDIEINPDGSVKVTINGKTYTFKIVEQPGNAVGTSYETLQIVLPNGQTLQLPPGAKLGNNEKGELVVFNKAGKEIATIRFNADGSFSINGIQFVITEVDGFQVFLGIDDNGKIWIKAGKNGVEKSIEITPDMKSVEIFKRNGDLVIRYSYSNGISEEVVIQGSPTATPAPGGTPAPGVNKPRDNNEALEWLKSGDSEKIKIALEYLMKNFNSLTDEQKNSLAELLGNLLGLLFEIDGWENFLKTLFEDGKIKDVHKLLIAQRILGLVHQLLVSEAGKNLLKSILDFLIAKTPGPADAFDYYQNLLEQYLLVISQQEGGRDFLEDYIGKLALSALGKSKWSSEYKKLDKVIKTMLRLGFGHFLEEIAYRLSNPNNPNEKKNAGKLIREIMQASVLPGPTASYDDWLKWLKENPARIEEFLDWLKDHPDYIDDFLTWIRRKENIELWDAFLNLLTGKNALAKKVVEILAKSDAGIKFLADLLEGQNSPLRNDKEKRENLAWALEGLIADLVNKAKGTNSEISRAAVALLLAMARYGNDNALEALKSLAEKGNIFAIQAIQYLITDNNRTDLLDFLVKLASDPKLRDKVLEALGLLVNDKSIEQKIRAGAIRTLIEIAKRGLDEATRIAAVNKLWQLGI